MVKLNPNSKPVKELEMTVLRAVQLIQAFDELEDGADWTAVKLSTFRKIFGKDYYTKHRMLEEVWARYRKGTLYSEVLDLHANLPKETQGRKEIRDGIRRIRKRTDT